MKAVRTLDFGGPEVLRFGDYLMPEVGPLDVLVRIEATTVSGFDLKYRSGVLHKKSGENKSALPGRNPFPMPMQLGRDDAGIVDAVGPEVKRCAALAICHPESRVPVTRCSERTHNTCRAPMITGHQHSPGLYESGQFFSYTFRYATCQRLTGIRFVLQSTDMRATCKLQSFRR